ncbi:sterol 3beta-glucosyltransferase [Thermocatellispora tengchongensis]|uniref:Sterol 3beta-glucosyltransferase n=1 Tax=Thermocatellispora tengchongensis TaxID=1073253 RepID=A0A840P7V3_9ACTN|nr:glycosyltransferase [Thermocatellispora tengchongensis]MBB5137424.1 sterol 3beta-glucosyltransferase [Thermocatellispora tengchongensis]
MKVLILTHGTRGDVQPYAALALALLRAGHQAVLAAPAAMAGLARPHGITFAPVHDGPNTLMDDPHIRQAIETNYRGLRGKKIALEVMRRTKPLMAQVFEDMAEVAQAGADVVVHAPGIPGQHLAEWLGVPAVPAALQPVWVPTGAFRNPMVPLPLPPALNRASYLPIKLMLRSFGGIADTLRERRLSLPRRRGRHDILRRPDGGPATVLHGFSRHLLPGRLDYPSWVHTTGFWYLPAPPDWAPSPELAAFLAAGDAPVYIGFGSMAGTDPARVGRIVAEAVRLAGVRAVLASGWGGMHVSDLPDGVFQLEQAPHDWLFPRMAAIVHHGGSGTTGAALAAGRPQVICPFVADQPFWAARAHAAGIAPPPQPQRRLSPEGLAAAIVRAVTDEGMARTATALGERVRAENGAVRAVTILESL